MHYHVSTTTHDVQGTTVKHLLAAHALPHTILLLYYYKDFSSPYYLLIVWSARLPLVGSPMSLLLLSCLLIQVDSGGLKGYLKICRSLLTWEFIFTGLINPMINYKITYRLDPPLAWVDLNCRAGHCPAAYIVSHCLRAHLTWCYCQYEFIRIDHILNYLFLHQMLNNIYSHMCLEHNV